jgi:nucleoside-diphosphate-sugar epimerase
MEVFMNVLITGSKGFVGTATKKYIAKVDTSIKIYDYDIMDGLDIRNKQQLLIFCLDNKIDRILHLAAISRFADADRLPRLAYETNVLGTKNVAEVAKELQRPVIYSSTGSVYMPITQEPPITEEFKVAGNSQYACSKLIGEKYIRDCNPYMILRYAHIYGTEKRGHGLVGGYWARIQRGLQPKLMGGTQSNDFCYEEDIAQANYLAITATWDKYNQIYNIGSGEELTAEKAGEIVCKVTGWEGGVEKVAGREVDAKRFIYDISKASSMLGYKPKFKFVDGITEMFKEEICNKAKQSI